MSRARSPGWPTLLWSALVWSGLGAATALADASPPPTPSVIASIDLSYPFDTRSAWSFTANQGPPIADPFGSSGDQLPGTVSLCLRKGASGPCDTQLQGSLPDTSDDILFSERHYLEKAEIVRPHGKSGRPILLLVTASLHSGDGDQLVLTHALAYQTGPDHFVRVYEHSTGTNNNQEVHYMNDGPLAGDIISVDQAETAPYGYWVCVNTLTSARGYRQVLRYRSATAYGDGNPLPVIDSEMANIQRRLGRWRPGSPLPRPATPCPRPHLSRMELWCE